MQQEIGEDQDPAVFSSLELDKAYLIAGRITKVIGTPKNYPYIPETYPAKPVPTMWSLSWTWSTEHVSLKMTVTCYGINPATYSFFLWNEEFGVVPNILSMHPCTTPEDKDIDYLIDLYYRTDKYKENEKSNSVAEQPMYGDLGVTKLVVDHLFVIVEWTAGILFTSNKDKEKVVNLPVSVAKSTIVDQKKVGTGWRGKKSSLVISVNVLPDGRPVLGANNNLIFDICVYDNETLHPSFLVTNIDSADKSIFIAAINQFRRDNKD